MNLYLDAIKRARDCRRLILAGVIHHNHKIDNAMRHHLVVSLVQGARRVVGGHHHHNFLAA
jgi:hypothetical protein